MTRAMTHPDTGAVIDAVDSQVPFYFASGWVELDEDAVAEAGRAAAEQRAADEAAMTPKPADPVDPDDGGAATEGASITKTPAAGVADSSTEEK